LLRGWQQERSQGRQRAKMADASGPEEESLISQFTTFTDEKRQSVIEYYLELGDFDLARAVDLYLSEPPPQIQSYQGGGLPSTMGAGSSSDPMLMEDEDSGGEEGGGGGRRRRRRKRGGEDDADEEEWEYGAGDHYHQQYQHHHQGGGDVYDEEGVRRPDSVKKQRLLNGIDDMRELHDPSLARKAPKIPVFGYEKTAKTEKEKTLAKLYAAPTDIIMEGSFDDARALCGKTKWLFVNIQHDKEFESHELNRDVWSEGTVKEIIKTSFVLWQQQHDSAMGKWYVERYKVTEFPHIEIIDPRTGGSVWTWRGKMGKKSKAENFLEKLMDFTSSNPEPGCNDHVLVPVVSASAMPSASDLDQGEEKEVEFVGLSRSGSNSISSNNSSSSSSSSSSSNSSSSSSRGSSSSSSSNGSTSGGEEAASAGFLLSQLLALASPSGTSATADAASAGTSSEIAATTPTPPDTIKFKLIFINNQFVMLTFPASATAKDLLSLVAKKLSEGDQQQQLGMRFELVCVPVCRLSEKLKEMSGGEGQDYEVPLSSIFTASAVLRVQLVT